MKKLVLSSIIILIGITFLSRLSYLQVFRVSPNQILEDPAVTIVYDYPERGYIYDRNGELLVANQPAYDVMVIPREVKPLDTLEFCSMLGITKELFLTRMERPGSTLPASPPFWCPNSQRRIMPACRRKCANTRDSTLKNAP